MPKIIISEERAAKLDWAFSQIIEYMMDADLVVLRCPTKGFCMVYVGEE